MNLHLKFYTARNGFHLLGLCQRMLYFVCAQLSDGCYVSNFHCNLYSLKNIHAYKIYSKKFVYEKNYSILLIRICWKDEKKVCEGKLKFLVFFNPRPDLINWIEVVEPPTTGSTTYHSADTPRTNQSLQYSVSSI